MIYFARSPLGGPVKIGRTDNPRMRLYQLNRDYRIEIQYIRTIDVIGLWCERWMHRRFLPYRIQGEWFRYVPEMLTVELPPANAYFANETLAEERAMGHPKRANRTENGHCEEIRAMILAETVSALPQPAPTTA